MKKMYLLGMAIAVSSIVCAQTVFINEIHYDNVSWDEGEGFEIAGPAGFDLSGYLVLLYNGNDSKVYSTINLSGVFTNQSSGLGFIWFGLPSNGMQNDDEGIALIDNSGVVLQFLSYEGVITAVDGAASGMISKNIGFSENASTQLGHSLQLTGTGSTYSDFTWSAPSVATPGLPNNSQTLPVIETEIEKLTIYPNPVTQRFFTIKGNIKELLKIEMYSLIGAKISTQQVFVNEPIFVNNLVQGTYFVKIICENKFVFRKFIAN